MAMFEGPAPAEGTRLSIEHEGASLAATVAPMPFLDPKRTLAKA